MQIESDFIKSTYVSIGYPTYIPFELPGMRTVPATHPRLSAWFTRIGEWFTEKGEAWGEHKYYVVKKRFDPKITFGDYSRDGYDIDHSYEWTGKGND